MDLERLDPPPSPKPRAARHSTAALLQAARARGSFLLFVVAPTLFGAIYFLLIAADRYETDTSFVVKSPSSAAVSQFSGIVSGSGVVASNEDAYIVHAYLRSRDAVRALANDADLIARLSRREADFVWAYPGFLRAPGEERLWLHFQKFLTLDFDAGTGITTLKVQAFRAEDAREIAEVLLTSAEALLNTLGARAQKEALRSAEEEVEATRERARRALEEVTQFRRRTSMIDPVKTSALALETVTALSVEIARTNAELSELRASSPDSPQTKTLERRVAAFEQQIASERTALAGAETSLAPLLAEYEGLMLEREFAERTFASALTAFEVARIDAERQRLYLERISAPATVDYPRYPFRILSILLIFAAAYMLHSIGRALLSDILSHAGK